MDHRLLIHAAVALVAGCLQAPGYDNTMYTCSESTVCPPGYSCRAGVCSNAETDGGMDVGSGDPNLVAFPAGMFDLGCTPGSLGCMTNWEKHTITLTAFAIDKYEVAQEDYDACVLGSSACQAPNTNVYDPLIHPRAAVRGVSHTMARYYCMTRGMDLPTEAQWERAARTFDETYPWGDAMAMCTLANFDTCAVGHPEDVDQHEGKTGLFQLAGNVREWVSDYFIDNYAAIGQSTNPDYQSETGTRVLRGGSYATGEMTLRVWWRDSADKAQKVDDAGFRCAKQL